MHKHYVWAIFRYAAASLARFRRLRSILYYHWGVSDFPRGGCGPVNILLVEDDIKLASFVAKGLGEAGYAVTHATNGEDGFHELTTGDFDLAVADLMLPKLDGLSMIEQARAQGVTTPILILSAKRSVDERIRGLQAGGDDYLVKPFDFGELLARIQAILRRGTDTQPTQLAVGTLRMDLIRRRVERGDNEIELHAREFSLLEYLMRNAGRVVSKTSILRNMSGATTSTRPPTSSRPEFAGCARSSIPPAKNRVYVPFGVSGMSSKKAARRKPSLALRLAAGSALITATCFLASFAAMYVSLSTTTHQRLDDRLRHEAAELQSLIGLQGLSEVQNLVAEMASAEGTEIVFYRVADRHGTTIAESDTTMWQGLVFDPPNTGVGLDAPCLKRLNCFPVATRGASVCRIDR